MTAGVGAARPAPALPSGVVGMAIFLGTEVMFFAGLVSAYLVLRAGALGWPPAGQPRLPVEVTGANTLVLLASGWTLWRAGRSRARARWLVATAALGALFLAVQGYEWARLIGFGLTTRSSLYGATFYAIVGAHAVHVVAALAALAWVAARPRDGSFVPVRMFWAFVVAVWPVLYLVVYL